MPIKKQDWITRQDLRNNPDTLYIFGDNEARTGFGGQAKEMRGEPNAVGIATKKAPTYAPSAFWSDSDLERQQTVFLADLGPVISALEAGKDVIYPSGGIGTDRARLSSNAPKTLKYISETFDKLFEEYGELDDSS